MDVSASFSKLLELIQPSPFAIVATNSHIDTVRTQLESAFETSK